MRRHTGPITPGHVRRTSPTACSVMPFPGSSTDDLEQLRWLAQHYARQVPYGMDWPLNFWSKQIPYEAADHAAHCWLAAYFDRNQAGSLPGNETRH